MRGMKLAIVIALSSIALFGCGEDAGPPFTCGTSTCDGNQACLNETDGAGRDDYRCVEDRECVNPQADYCPGAESSFCRRENVAMGDGGDAGGDAGEQLATFVSCRFR